MVSAQFIKQDPPGPPPTLAGRKLPFSTNESSVGGRLVLIVFDLEGIGVGGGRGATVAASRFLDQLAAADRVGVLAFPNGASIDFTTDREKVKQTLMRVVGRGHFFADGIYNIGLSEAFDVDRGDPSAFERLVAARVRQRARRQEGLELCRTSLESQARSMAMVNRQHGVNSLQTLRSLLTSFAKIDAPKTVVWISEGLALAEDRVEIGGMAAMAAAARTTIYSLHLDQSIIADASRSRPSPVDDAGPPAGHRRARDDRRHHPRLDVHVDWHRQQRLRAHREGDDRVLPAERRTGSRGSRWPAAPHQGRRQSQGRQHPRAPRVHAGARKPPAPPSPAQRLAAVLQQPLLATELPIKVATYNLRTPGASTVKVVVTTEFGRNATAAEDATVAYVVLTDKGKVAGTSVTANKAAPVRTTAPGPLQATTIIEVPPGKYLLRLGRARCQRTRGQRRAPARGRAVVGRRRGSRRPAAGAGQCRHRRGGASGRGHDD